MGEILNEMLAEIEVRCSIDPEGEKAFRFLREWIDVSLEMGLDPDYRREFELKLGEGPQETLF